LISVINIFNYRFFHTDLSTFKKVGKNLKKNVNNAFLFKKTFFCKRLLQLCLSRQTVNQRYNKTNKYFENLNNAAQYTTCEHI